MNREPHDPESLILRRESHLGGENVVAAEARRWSVDGMALRVAVRPADAAGVCEVLRLCAESGASVVPWGGGTSIDVGNPPLSADVVLLTERLSRVVDHDHSNMTVTVEAGVTLGGLAGALAGHGQFLPLEPPRTEEATAGGAAAAALSGPRRARYGAARDLVLGIRVALTEGRVARSGGKTVKNVAGYDMCKLFVGSFGSLGVITELTFKLQPLPERSQTLLAFGTDQAAVFGFALRVLGSVLQPSAVTLLNPAAAGALGISEAAGAGPGGARACLAIRAEGLDQAVRRQVRDAGAWAGDAGLEMALLEGDSEESAWRGIRDLGWSGSPERTVVARLSLPPGRVGDAFERLGGLLPGGASLAAHAGCGTLWSVLDADEGAPALIALRRTASDLAGHLLVARAPAALKSTSDVWFPAPAALAAMRDLKAAFDPMRILNPGRFVARL